MSNIKVKDLYTPSNIDYIDEYVFSKEYPWELLGGIKEYIRFHLASPKKDKSPLVDLGTFMDNYEE